MAIDKRIPRFLNLDDDVRLLQETDMIDAKNVRSISSEGKNAGALEAVRSDVKINNPNLPAGEKKVIGATKIDALNNIYFALWNKSNNHGIYKYNNITNTIELVLQDSKLNFQKRKYVSMVAYQSRGGTDVLLYFTDSVNPPRKINVGKAQRGDYGAITNEKINLLKYAPSKEPSWKYNKDSSFLGNIVYKNTYQFRYRYKYDDGEVSVYSPISSLAYDVTALNSITLDSGTNANNNIKIDVQKGSNIVEKIEIIARRGNLGEWFVIDEINNRPLGLFGNDTMSIDFKDTGAYSAADPRATNQYFDNVPINAGVISIVNSILFLGSYKDGYNLNPDIAKAVSGYITLNPFMEESNGGTPKEANSISVSKNVSNKTFDIKFDLSNLSFTGANSRLEITFEGDVQFEYIDPNDPAIIKRPKVVISKVEKSAFSSSTSSISNLAGDIVNSFQDQFILGSQSYIDSIGQVFRFTVRVVSATYSSGILTVKLGAYNTSRVNPQRDFLIDPFGSSLTNTAKLYESSDVGSSFKKGGVYELGIIEYDEGMRASTVNIFKDNEINFPSFNKSFPKIETEKGRAFLDYRIHTDIKPQLRTKYWSWAITKNKAQDTDNFVQYSVSGASKTNTVDNIIYLNFDNLSVGNNGYLRKKGADIFNNFLKGDFIRVLEYYDKSDDTRKRVNGDITVRILSAEFYDDTTSPVPNTKGYWIGVEAPDIDGWKASDVQTNNSFWSPKDSSVVVNSDNSKPLVEVFRLNPETLEDNQVYYEVGGINEVENAGLSNRYFKGNVRDKSRISYDDASKVSSNVPEYISLDAPSIDYVVGEVINIYNSSGTFIKEATIEDIIYSNSNTRVYIDTSIPSNINSIANEGSFSVGRIKDGDVWYRIRDIQYSVDLDYVPTAIEDARVSDFFSSLSWSKGRANAYDEKAKEVLRSSSLCYGLPYFSETNQNGFSTFDLGQINFEQYNQAYGAINALKAKDSYLYVFQENKIGKVPVERRILESAGGGTTLALSDKMLNIISYYKKNYGLTKRESILEYDGDFYGYDIKKGKVWGLYYNGISEISDFKVSSLFDDKSPEILPFSNTINVVLGVDREFGEVILSSPDASGSGISDGVPGGKVTPPAFGGILDDGGGNLILPVEPIDTPVTAKPGLGSEDKPLNGNDVPFGDLDGSLIDINQIPQNGGVVGLDLGSENDNSVGFVGKLGLTGGVTETVIGTIDKSQGVMIIPKTQNGFNLDLDTNNAISYSGFTLSYHSKANRWISFFDYQSELFANINYSFFRFKDGEMYRMNRGVDYGSFGGTYFFPSFEVSFNASPSKVKRYLTTSIEGTLDNNFSLDLKTNLVQASLDKFFWEEKEGILRSYVPRGTTGGNASSYIGLGEIATINGAFITVDGLSAYDSGLFVGDRVYDASNSNVGDIVEITGKDGLKLSNVVGLTVGDFILVKKPDNIDGDEVRGYYCNAKYEAKTALFMEVFAVNMNVIESKLHNT